MRMFPPDQIADQLPNASYGFLQFTKIDPERDYTDRHFDLLDNSPTKTFSYRILKRAFDLSAVLLISPLLIAIGAVIALCIFRDSSGSVFFSHRRIQRGGCYFRMWKFRTMCLDAQQVLERHFVLDPELRKEWSSNRKLRVDPRVSALGAFLRRTSLDELPQIWNVFTGTMSLVGPRPIVAEEIEKYGADFAYYTAVKPGITGLWQSSGRSTLTYAERVALHRFYVENWSLWLEIKILVRTIWSVAVSDGAY